MSNHPAGVWLPSPGLGLWPAGPSSPDVLWHQLPDLAPQRSLCSYFIVPSRLLEPQAEEEGAEGGAGAEGDDVLEAVRREMDDGAEVGPGGHGAALCVHAILTTCA